MHYIKSLSTHELQSVHGGADGDFAYVTGFAIGVAAGVLLMPLVPFVVAYDIYTNHL